MNNLKKIFAPVALVAALTLQGCGSDPVTNAIVDSLTDNDADISYINALDEQATFYVKGATESRSVYNSDHKVDTLLVGEVSNEIRHKWFGLVKSEFAVEDTNTNDERYDFSKHLEDNEDYWAVAWLKNRDYRLSVFKKSSSDRDGQYRVRIFANKALNVYVDGSQSKSLTTEAGEISDRLTIDNCTGLVVGDNEIDLCQQGNLGESYIVVVDEDGLIAMAEE